jgi:hypothetical protein
MGKPERCQGTLGCSFINGPHMCTHTHVYERLGRTINIEIGEITI